MIAASFFSKQVAIKFKGLGKGFKKLGSSEIGKEGTRSSQVELGPLVDLYTKGKLEEAMATVKGMLVKYPRSTAVYNIKGAVEMVLKDYEQLLKLLK